MTLRIGQDVDVGMLVVLDVGWRDRRSSTAVTMIGGATTQHAVVLREHVTELRHSAAQTGRLFDEVNLQAGVRQVERSPHPTDAAANNHDRSNRRFAKMSCSKSGHRATSLLLMRHEKRDVSYNHLADFIIRSISIIYVNYEKVFTRQFGTMKRFRRRLPAIEDTIVCFSIGQREVDRIEFATSVIWPSV